MLNCWAKISASELSNRVAHIKVCNPISHTLPTYHIYQDEEALSTSDSTHSGPTPNDPLPTQSNTTDVPRDLLEAQRREGKLKTRIHELVDTLEKLSKNSEVRHKQTAEYICDLKKANGALVTAYEKAKKRHASRLKKFEQQLVQMAEKYQSQVCGFVINNRHEKSSGENIFETLKIFDFHADLREF